MHRNSSYALPSARLVALLALCATLATAAEPKPPLVRQLSEFGDTGGKSLRETYEKAIAEPPKVDFGAKPAPAK